MVHRWCDNLQKVYNMCMMRSTLGAIHHYEWSYEACTVMHYGESSLHNCESEQSFPSDFPLLVPQYCQGAPVVQKIMHQVGAKATDTRTQSNAHGVSNDISAAVPWWRWQVSGPDHHRWWNMGCTHYPRNQALASQWISLQDGIQADFVGIDFLTRGETVNAEHYCETLWQTECCLAAWQCSATHGLMVNISPAWVQLGGV